MTEVRKHARELTREIILNLLTITTSNGYSIVILMDDRSDRNLVTVRKGHKLRTLRLFLRSTLGPI